MAFTSLAHHIDIEWLKEAFAATRKDGAKGIDGQSAAEYAVGLEKNLQSLLDRAKSGDYRAPPVRRVHIPKGDGTTRPLGIPTFEDKVLQRAVAMLLESIYEEDFLDCSFGFRPMRSAHDALESFRSQMMEMRGGWVVEVDLKKFFDTLDHKVLRELLQKRVRDGVLLRLIGKWLNAGVMEDGVLSASDTGTPQGGVISPLLANVYLHEVLDVWFEEEVKPRLQGRACLVRYADDFVIGCEHEVDAKRIFDVLPKRMGKYGLTVHPEKTRLVRFRPPRPSTDHDDESPGSFDLLGFTHYWGLSRKGRWVIKRKTAKSRLRRALKRIADWCRVARHWPIREQHRTLSQKLRGHYGYYGITANSSALWQFRYGVRTAWKRALATRSNRPLTYARFEKLLAVFPLPAAIAVHSELRKANP